MDINENRNLFIVNVILDFKEKFDNFSVVLGEYGVIREEEEFVYVFVLYFFIVEFD